MSTGCCTPAESPPRTCCAASRLQQDAPDAVILPGDEDDIEKILELLLAAIASPWCPSAAAPAWSAVWTRSAVTSTPSSPWTCAALTPCTGSTRSPAKPNSGAGLTGPEAERLLGERGFSLGHFPQSFRFASIGGYAATRSSGQDSAGYGRFNDMVRGMHVITPAGRLDLGRAPASAAGPDLRELFCGSEGAFGVITRVRLRVHPVPESVRYEAWSFPDFATGAAALRAVVQTGTGPTVLRLSDEVETGVNLATAHSIGEQSVTGGCLAITVFEGTDAHTESRHAETHALLSAHGGTSLGEAPAKAWEQGRFDAPYLRDSLLKAGAICETLETATSWSNLPVLKTAVTEALTSALKASGTAALVMCHISHVYPTGASLYFTVVAGQRGDVARQWRGAKVAACDAIIANGGTITHHHAVGADHRPWMGAEIGDLGAAVLRAVKQTLDPVGILNPGKLIP